MQTSVNHTASAPVRTADAGGWTDTWFARTGVVCNIALAERARVRVALDPVHVSGVQLCVALTGQVYEFEADEPPGLHPMLETAIARLPLARPARIEVGGDLESGSGLGSSAAVMVALVAALCSARGQIAGPAELAELAHQCEVAAGRESGVQDHVAAAFGGVSLIEIEYPRFRRTGVPLASATSVQLASRLLTVSFGRPHASSAMHDAVIARLSSRATPVALGHIRAAARNAAVALSCGDLAAYGSALVENHEAIRSMHPGLVSQEAHELIAMATGCAAVGWKVNGAGGDGGSMVVVGPSDPEQGRVLRHLIGLHPRWRVIDCPVDSLGVTTARHDAECA